MTAENTTTTFLRASSGESEEESLEESLEGRRNRKARVLNALLSASALGVFLEGCGANLGNLGNDVTFAPPNNGDALTNGNYFLDGSNDNTPYGSDDNTPDGSDDNTPDGSDDNTPDGSDDNTPDGYVDSDNYIVDDGSTVTISFDTDGGRLLFRDAGNNEVIEFTLYDDNAVSITIGEESVYIDSSPALRNGSYSVHVGADDVFAGYLYIGTSSSETLITDGRGTGRLVGFSGDDTLTGNFAADGVNGGAGDDELFGFGGDDILRGGDGIDTLQGGVGNDELLGEAGGDIYLFDAGDGNDIIRGEGDGVGNKLLFEPLSEGPYADSDFAFYRGFLRGGKDLAEHASGTDLEIVVSLEGVEMNRVIVQNYFASGDDAYTIYRDSLSEDTIVQTAPAETS